MDEKKKANISVIIEQPIHHQKSNGHYQLKEKNYYNI